MKSLRTELRRAWLAGRHIAWQAGTAFLLAGCLSVDDPTQTGGCAPGVACVASPAAVTGSHVFTTLAAGRYHTCGLKANGEVWCWGLNAAGQLGASSSGSSSAAPIRVNGQLVFESISAGDFHTCGITADEEVYCWGSNVNSTLGVADVADTCNGLPCSRGPVRAGGATFTAVSLDVGSTHTCALDADGVAHCWGQNAVGEVGSDEFDSAFSEPNTVQGGPFEAVSAGYQFNCTVNAGGALSCWGSGEEGQLATTDVDHCGPLLPRCTPDPKPAATTLTFASISAGNAFACGVTPASTIACWGRNSEQQLGVGGFTPSSAPLPLDATGFWGSVSTGYFHACALQTDGTPYCWGLNNNAQLGDGSTALTQGRPQPVTGGRVFTQIVAGSDHTCALAFNGAAWCWGNNQVGQVGVN